MNLLTSRYGSNLATRFFFAQKPLQIRMYLMFQAEQVTFIQSLVALAAGLDQCGDNEALEYMGSVLAIGLEQTPEHSYEVRKALSGVSCLLKSRLADDPGELINQAADELNIAVSEVTDDGSSAQRMFTDNVYELIELYREFWDE